jgi:hypothetical protein
MSPRTEIESTLPTADARRPEERVDGAETKKQVRPSPVWGFLNSAFGLWLLSSVLLSFAVYVFQQWQDYRHEQQSAIEKQERINVEALSLCIR